MSCDQMGFPWRMRDGPIHILHNEGPPRPMRGKPYGRECPILSPTLSSRFCPFVRRSLRLSFVSSIAAEIGLLGAHMHLAPSPSAPSHLVATIVEWRICRDNVSKRGLGHGIWKYLRHCLLRNTNTDLYPSGETSDISIVAHIPRVL
jgi:hypothetical protein